MPTSNAILLSTVAILAIANLNLWALNTIDRGVDRQIELRRLVMKEQRTGTTYQCYAVKAAKPTKDAKPKRKGVPE